MTDNDDDIFGAALRKLQRLAPLDDDDRAAFRALPYQVKPIATNATLIREGEVVTHCPLLLDGYACRYKETGDGGRQIVSFHMPGDLLGLAAIKLPRADHGVRTIAAATVALVPLDAIRKLIDTYPRIADALWQDTLIDASIFREWVLNIGRRDARARIAHMLCEFAARAATGLGTPERITLPMTQTDIADATGLTPVHVNRTLRELDQSGAIVRDKRNIQITDWNRLKQIADFDPSYLHAAAAA